jgi:hypothetical protein
VTKDEARRIAVNIEQTRHLQFVEHHHFGNKSLDLTDWAPGLFSEWMLALAGQGCEQHSAPRK